MRRILKDEHTSFLDSLPLKICATLFCLVFFQYLFPFKVIYLVVATLFLLLITVFISARTNTNLILKKQNDLLSTFQKIRRYPYLITKLSINTFFKSLFIPLILIFILSFANTSHETFYLYHWKIERNILSIFTFITMYLFGCFIFRKSDNVLKVEKTIIRFLVFAVPTFTLLAFAPHLIHSSLLIKTNKYHISFGADYNYFAMILLLGIVANYMLLTQHTTKLISKILLCASTLIISLGIYFSYSRRGIVVLTLLAFFLTCKTVVTYYKKNKKFILVIPLIIIVLAVTLASLHTQTSEKLLLPLQRYLTIDHLSSIMPRLRRWNLAFDTYASYNFIQKMFGDGLNFIGIYAKVFHTAEGGAPHNPLLSALLQGGLLLLLFVAAFYVRLLSLCLKYRKELTFIVAAILIMLAFDLISATTFITNKAFVLTMFLPFIYDHLRSLESKNPQDKPRGIRYANKSSYTENNTSS